MNKIPFFQNKRKFGLFGGLSILILAVGLFINNQIKTNDETNIQEEPVSVQSEVIKKTDTAIQNKDKSEEPETKASEKETEENLDQEQSEELEEELKEKTAEETPNQEVESVIESQATELQQKEVVQEKSTKPSSKEVESHQPSTPEKQETPSKNEPTSSDAPKQKETPKPQPEKQSEITDVPKETVKEAPQPKEVEEPTNNNGMSPQMTKEYQSEVLRLVNTERTNAGLNPLGTEYNLETAAMKRAEELKQSFSHTRPDGSRFSTVLSQYNISYMAAGENLAMNYPSPQDVVTGWMNSSGHRANILNKNFTQLGVGIVRTTTGSYLWTQIFIGN